MTYTELQKSLDWSLQTTSNLKGKLDEVNSKLEKTQSLVVAIQTAVAISGGDNAKAGQLIRQLLEPKP
jgi:hypothetical protein